MTAEVTRVQLCGRLAVTIGGEPREGALTRRQARLLLAFLVLHRHAPVGRERLAEALWGDTLPRDPAAVLSTLLSNLRRDLGDDVLEGRREVRIDLGPGAEVDVELAVRARDRALDALARTAFAEAEAEARTCLELTAGELLPGDAAEWLDRERDVLNDVRADALEALGRAGLERGGTHLAGAVTAATELVALVPFRESAHQLLMELHAARGDVAQALVVFDELRMRLREELGVPPTEPLRRLHRRLLAMEGPATGPGRAPLRLPPRLERQAPFVGRAGPVAALEAALAEAAVGARRVVVVGGEPGIGKTSLAAQVAARAHADGVAVLYGRASERPLVPYEPFVEAIVHLVAASPAEALTPEANPELEDLARWMPDLGRTPASAAPEAEPATRRFRLFEALAALLARVARERPLLVVLDDLQWADPSTVLLLRHLASGRPAPGLTLLLTYRDTDVAPDGELAAALADLRREPDAVWLTLGGLDVEETAQLAGGDRALAERLHALTDGNPLFVEELLRAISGVPGDPVAALDAVGAPAAVSDMIGRRLAHLPPRTAEVLGIAAVLGAQFRLPVLEEVAGTGPDEALDLLEAALGAGLVVELPERPLWFTFRHALVRAALAGRLSAARRVRLHAQAAAVLERRRAELGVGAAELAEHLLAACPTGSGERAARYAAQAGEHALGALAYEEAATWFTRALTALPDGADAERCDLLLARGDAELRAGRPQARTAFEQAAALARGRWPDRLARAAIGAAGRYVEAGVVDRELITLLEEALGAPADRLRAQVLARLGEALHFAGDPDRALTLTADAVTLARREDDPDTLAAALAGRHVALLHVEHLDDRLAVSAELHGIAHRGQRRELAVLAAHARMYDLLELGDVAAARRTHDQLKRAAAELRQPLYRHFAGSWAVVFAQVDGRFAAAEELAVELFTLQQQLGARDAETVFAARLLAIRRDQGRLGELLPIVDGFDPTFRAFWPVRAFLPLLCLAAGDRDRGAAELAATAAELDRIPRDFHWTTVMAGLAEAAAQLGDAALCRRLGALLAPYAGRTVQVGFATCLGPVERLLGLLAAGAGDDGAARTHLERALVRSSALGLRTLVVRAQAELATCLLALGDDARGSELRDAALAGSRELGMDGVVAGLELV